MRRVCENSQFAGPSAASVDCRKGHAPHKKKPGGGLGTPGTNGRVGRERRRAKSGGSLGRVASKLEGAREGSK